MTDQVQTVDTPAEVPAKPAVDPGVQKRINELTWKHREQERRAAAAEAELAKYREKEKSAPAAVETEKRKTLADFNYDDVAYEDYLAERVTKRASETAAKEATKAVEEREQKKAQETTAAERSKAWKARVDTFAKDHPDFVEKVYAEDVDFSDAVAEAIADSELGPQLAYYLAQNPEELSRISRLSPIAVGRELGKLEVKLAVPEAKQEPSEEITSAEDPPKPKIPPTPKLNVTSETGRRPSTTSKDSDKLSDEDWFKAEQQRLAAKRKRSNG